MTEFRRRTGDLIERTQFLKVLTIVLITCALLFNFLPWVVKFPVDNRDLVIQAQSTINNMGFVVAISYWFRYNQEKEKEKPQPPTKE